MSVCQPVVWLEFNLFGEATAMSATWTTPDGERHRHFERWDDPLGPKRAVRLAGLLAREIAYDGEPSRSDP